VAPEVETRALGQVVGLVGEARAPAARVAFLQADDVVQGGQFGSEARLLPAGSTCDQLRVA